MKKGKLIVSICAFALAAVFVVLSFIDSIAIIGKYRVKEIDGKSFAESELSTRSIEKKTIKKLDEAMKVYLVFNASGDFKPELSFNEKKFKEAMLEIVDDAGYDIDEDVIEDVIEDAIEDIKFEQKNLAEEASGVEWELDDDKLILNRPEEDDETEYDYELGFGDLTLEDEYDSELKLVKEGVDLFFCPSMILREVALCLIILGVLLLIIKGKKPYVPSIAAVEVTSATHTIPPVFSESYGTSVGGAIEKKEPEYSGYVSPAPAYEAAPTAPAVKYCENCGGILADDNKFCEVCGTPVAGAVEQSVPEYSGYVSPAPAAPAVKYCENCGNVLTEGFKFCQECGTPTASAPTEELKFEEAGDARLKSTFREVEPSYDSTPPVTVSAPETSGSTSAPSSDMSFSQAGDL